MHVYAVYFYFLLMCMLLFFLFQVPYFDLSSETWEEYQTMPEHTGRIDNLSRHDEENHQMEGGSCVLCVCTWIRWIRCVVHVYMDWVDQVCCARVHGLGGSCVLCMCSWIRWIMYIYTVCCAWVQGFENFSGEEKVHKQHLPQDTILIHERR